MMHKTMVNRNKLLGLMAQRHMRKKDLCSLLDISYTALKTKLDGGVDFSETEIATLSQTFGEGIFLR